MKKGQIETVAVVLSLLIVLGGIAYGTFTIANENRFVGDLNTKLVYDPSKCKISSINIQRFSSLDEAHSLGFKDAPNCI